MRFWSYSLVLGLLLTACGTAKKAANDGPSAADYPYIQKFHEGVRLKEKGQLQEAIAAFQTCFAEKPQDDAVAFALAQCYLSLDQRKQASEYTEKAAKIDPGNIWYTQELAYMYFEQGRLDDAAKCFEKMIARQPQNIDWLFGYAEVLKRLNKNQQAIDAYDKMEEQLGVLPDLSIQKYDLYMSMKQEAKALNELSKAKKIYPEDLSILGTYVDHYFQKQDIQKAKDMLVELVKANPSNGRANLALGDLYMREDNRKEAYKYFKAAFMGDGVEIDTKMEVLLTMYEQQTKIDKEVFELADLMVSQYPEDAKPYSVLGDLYLKNNEEDEALIAYKEALKFEQSKFAIWNQVLMLEYRQQRFDELYKDARACSALFPTITSVQLFYTIACVQTGRFQEAVDAADIGKEIVINDKVTEAEFYAQKGEALFKSNDVAGGTENFEKAMQLDPSNQLTKSNYAMMLALSGQNLAKANTLIDEVMTKYPNQAPFIDTKGMILFKEGKFSEAKEKFALAHSLNAKDRNYADHLGDAWSKAGDAEKAVEFWKLAKSLGSPNKIIDKKIQTKTYYAPVY